MFSKEESYLIRKKFWISFGQYMALQYSVDGTKVNWLNYKTGIKDLYFRSQVDNRSASVFIEMAQKDLDIQQWIYERFEMFENIFNSYCDEKWIWTPKAYDEQGKVISTISIKLENVSIFRETDWSSIINFLKKNLQIIDQFWVENKDAFDEFK